MSMRLRGEQGIDLYFSAAHYIEVHVLNEIAAR